MYIKWFIDTYIYSDTLTGLHILNGMNAWSVYEYAYVYMCIYVHAQTGLHILNGI
jgi:hypothetical protein